MLIFYCFLNIFFSVARVSLTGVKDAFLAADSEMCKGLQVAGSAQVVAAIC